jgi:hypothetical protein
MHFCGSLPVLALRLGVAEAPRKRTGKAPKKWSRQRRDLLRYFPYKLYLPFINFITSINFSTPR